MTFPIGKPWGVLAAVLLVTTLALPPVAAEPGPETIEGAARPAPAQQASSGASHPPGGAEAPLFRRGPGPRPPRKPLNIPILMYHYIRVNPDPADRIGFNLSVTPADFAAQLDYLADHGYRTVTFDAMAAYLAGERDDPPPRNAVVITLDDGYRDAYEAAYPLLRKHGFQATIFLITGLVGTPRYLSWDQIREMAAGGITFGAHTINHVDLAQTPRPRATREIVASKLAIEEALGQTVTTFCYPSGRFNEETIDLVRAAGYFAAVTVNYGTTHTAEERYALPRVRVSGGDSLATFARNARLGTAPSPGVFPIWLTRPKGGPAPE